MAVPVIVAGNPKAHVDALTAAGVQGFVHARSDAVQTLTLWQDRLGMASGEPARICCRFDRPWEW